LRRAVPTQIRRSYAAKFGIVLLVIGVSVGFIGSAATVQITNEVQDNVDSEYTGLASQEANTVEQWVQRNRLSTRLTAEDGTARSGFGQAIDDYLLTKSEELPEDLFALHVVNVDSQTVVSSTRVDTTGGTSVDANDQPWWGDVQSASGADPDSVFITDVYRNQGSQPVVAFVTPISDSNRVLVASFETMSVAKNNFQGARRTSGGFTQVVDGQDRIIMDEFSNKLLETYPQEANLPVRKARGLRGTSQQAGNISLASNASVFYEAQRSEYRDGSYVVGYAPIENTDWVVLVHAPQSEAYGFVTAVSQAGLLATLAGMLLIVVLGTFLGRNTASAIDRLTAMTQRMEEGDLSVDFETKRIDNIGRLYEAFGSMRDALREQIQEAQSARREAEEARETAEMMTQHLVEKADEYSQVMEAVADGDMTRRMDPESRSDAMEEIAVEFNEMIAEIEATTEQVKDFATEVATSSEEVTASSEEVKSASEQVTDSIQEISDGAERQNEQLQNVSNEMNSLSTTIEEIASSANEVADLSQQTAETGDEARESAEEAIDEMENVEREAEATVDAMENLQGQMEQIEEITEFITEVAEQTNILALNANIEAARAGEAGEGFAVVADEVKGLAEETRDAAEEIDQLVEDLRDQTETTAEEVQQTSTEVARSTEIVEETVESLEEIAGYAQETNTGVQEISDATTEQASSTNQVVGMVDEAASISEQTSRESENVAAAAEEQTTALTEVTNSASDLAEQASRLSSALERFSTDADGEGATVGAVDDGEDSPEALPSGEESPIDAVTDDHEPYRPDEEAGADTDASDATAEPAAEGDAEASDAGAEPFDADVADPLEVDDDVTGDIEVGDIESVVGDVETDADEAADDGAEPDVDGATAEAPDEGATDAAEAATRAAEAVSDADPEPAVDEASPEPAEQEAAADEREDASADEHVEEDGHDEAATDDAPVEADAGAAAASDDGDQEDVAEDAIDEWLDAQVETVDEAPDRDDAGEESED
jgi:methyl-accepting chemotaxis protein